jgi:Tfp pilus assembly protein PilF
LQWLWLGLYTSDPVALALNNIGACQIGLHELDQALETLGRALQRDPKYAVPHVNLALICRLRNDTARADVHAQTAMRLGYSEAALDQLLRRAIAAHNEALGRRA